MKTWLITGCSSGFGQRLALAAARRGDRVIATARNVETIAHMTEPFDGRMLALPLDVTDPVAARTAGALGEEKLHAGLLPFAERAVIAAEHIVVEGRAPSQQRALVSQGGFQANGARGFGFLEEAIQHGEVIVERLEFQMFVAGKTIRAVPRIAELG